MYTKYTYKLDSLQLQHLLSFLPQVSVQNLNVWQSNNLANSVNFLLAHTREKPFECRPVEGS
jgi:hypothetical protein